MLKRATLLILLLIVVSSDTLRLTPIELKVYPYLYNLSRWEITHLFDKWVVRLRDLLPGGTPSGRARQDLVQEYFSLLKDFKMHQETLRNVESKKPVMRDETLKLEVSLRDIEKEIGSMVPQVEEILEAFISGVIVDEGLALPFSLVLPPVDFVFDQSPKVLVTSPRDRIHRLDSFILQPDLSLEEIESIEIEILAEENYSALVENTGGLSTYPSIITGNSLFTTLMLASHEWIHHYLFFRPLGQHYHSDMDMSTLNETLAILAGHELAEAAYWVITGEFHNDSNQTLDKNEEVFDFAREMRVTRLKVESMLTNGAIDDAESYMEKRRRIFVNEGYYIRKLNQAYFAFHGTYADSPGSISPIYGELREMRNASSSLGSFVKVVSSAASYEEFQEILDQRRLVIQVEPSPG